MLVFLNQNHQYCLELIDSLDMNQLESLDYANFESADFDLEHLNNSDSIIQTSVD